MASTRDIRRRIKSVRNTRQITKAMELVATSKMKRAQQAALAGNDYVRLLSEMLITASARLEKTIHPFLEAREVRTRGILLVTTDRGLCGPLNSNLLRLISEIKTPARFVVVGRKGAQFIARSRRDMLADFPVIDRVPFAQVRPIVEFMVAQFLEGVIDTVEVAYPRFKNTLVQTPVIEQILPISNLQDYIAGRLRNDHGITPPELGDTRHMVFEPSAQAVVSALLPFYVNKLVHHRLLVSKASEHSARRVAMKTANDNANKLLGDLTLQYNKARQASITQEILEIAAAQAATT